MEFKVSGIVSDAQSGKKIPRVLVVAYDETLPFDELLGTAETDGEGRFTILYDKKDYTEFYGRGPDLYVAVYAPPCRRIVDTKRQVRFDASEHEFFNLRVSADAVAECVVEEGDATFADELLERFEWEVG